MRINDHSMNEPFKADKRKNEFIRFGKRDDFMKYYVILYFFLNSNMNLKMNFFGYRFELFCRELIFSISMSNSHYNAKLSFFFGIQNFYFSFKSIMNKLLHIWTFTLWRNVLQISTSTKIFCFSILKITSNHLFVWIYPTILMKNL